jgi:hypothetical protein
MEWDQTLKVSKPLREPRLSLDLTRGAKKPDNIESQTEGTRKDTQGNPSKARPGQEVSDQPHSPKK